MVPCTILLFLYTTVYSQHEPVFVSEACHQDSFGHTLEWSDDDQLVLCTGHDIGATLIDAGIGEIHSQYPHSGIHGARFNQDETQILTWGDDGYARVWDINDTEPDVEFRIDIMWMPPMAWSPDENYITAITQELSSSNIFEAATGEIWMSTPQPANFAWKPNEASTLSVSFDAQIQLWDVEQRILLREYHSDERIFGTRWSSDGELIAVWGDPLIILDDELEEIARFDARVTQGQWNIQNELLIETDQGIVIWNPVTDISQIFFHDLTSVFSYKWHPETNTIAFIMFVIFDPLIEIWNDSGKIFRYDNLPENEYDGFIPEWVVPSLQWSDDGSSLAYFTEFREALVFDTGTLSYVTIVKHTELTDYELSRLEGAFSHSSSHLATLSDRSINIHEIN